MTDNDAIIRPEMQPAEVRQRGSGYSAERLRSIERTLKKLHMLETMAVSIYKYEINSKRTTLDIYLTAAMANEMTHLQDFQIKLYEYGFRPSKMRLGYWIVGCFLGFGSRLLGPRRVLKTDVWSEQKAVVEYTRFLLDVEWDEETRPMVAKNLADEEGHAGRWSHLLQELPARS